MRVDWFALADARPRGGEAAAAAPGRPAPAHRVFARVACFVALGEHRQREPDAVAFVFDLFDQLPAVAGDRERPTAVGILDIGLHQHLIAEHSACRPAHFAVFAEPVVGRGFAVERDLGRGGQVAEPVSRAGRADASPAS